MTGAPCRKYPSFVIALLTALSIPVYGEEVVRIGVLAHLGDEEAMKIWTPTADYLSEEAPGYTFTIIPLDFKEIFLAVEYGEADLFIYKGNDHAGKKEKSAARQRDSFKKG